MNSFDDLNAPLVLVTSSKQLFASTITHVQVKLSERGCESQDENIIYLHKVLLYTHVFTKLASMFGEN